MKILKLDGFFSRSISKKINNSHPVSRIKLKNKMDPLDMTEGTSSIRKKQLQILRERQQKIKSKKESERKERAAKLMYEQFQKNCPELRDLETSRLQEHVKSVWSDQLQEKTIKQAEEDHKKVIEHQETTDRLVEQERLDKLNARRKIMEKEAIARALEIQLIELKERESKKKLLEKESELLLLETDRLRGFKEEQAKKAELNKNKKYAKLLWKQWRAQIRQRTIQRRHELENDKKLLENIELETSRIEMQAGSKREYLVKSVRENLVQVRERIQREKELEFKLDLMVREKGEEIWAQREQAWAKERKASEKLLQDVLSFREEQIQMKHEQNLETHRQLIFDQENLLAEIEHIKSETARDQLVAEKQKVERQNQRETEIHEKQGLIEGEIKNRELEEAERVTMHQIYKAQVEEEKERVLGTPFTERIYSRPSTSASARPSTSSTVRFNEPNVKYSDEKQSRPQTANSSYSRITGPFIY